MLYCLSYVFEYYIVIYMDARGILEFILKKEGVTYYKLSKMMGLPRVQPLYNIRDGAVKSITKNYAQKIIEAFPDSGYTLAFLMTGDESLINTTKMLVSEDSNVSMTVIDRVIIILDDKKLSRTAFSKLIGMPQTTVNNYILGIRSISFEFVEKILEAFPDISAEWLMRGKGNMCISGQESYPVSDFDIELIKQSLRFSQDTVEKQRKTIAELEDEILSLKAENAALKKGMTVSTNESKGFVG